MVGSVNIQPSILRAVYTCTDTEENRPSLVSRGPIYIGKERGRDLSVDAINDQWNSQSGNIHLHALDASDTSDDNGQDP